MVSGYGTIETSQIASERNFRQNWTGSEQDPIAQSPVANERAQGTRSLNDPLPAAPVLTVVLTLMLALMLALVLACMLALALACMFALMLACVLGVVTPSLAVVDVLEWIERVLLRVEDRDGSTLRKLELVDDGTIVDD